MDGRRIAYGVLVVLLGIGAGCICTTMPPDADRSLRDAERREAECQCDGEKTHRYWDRLGHIVCMNGNYWNLTASEVRNADSWHLARRKIQEIGHLDIVDVDQELLEFSGKIVDHLRETTAGVAALGWYHSCGWPLPTPVREFDERIHVLLTEMEKLRMTLSQRYKIEFALLDQE